MNIIVTGTMRDIANSAWISTTDEIKTKSRSDEDVERVVRFLIKNHHTSPLECITITVEGWDEEWGGDATAGFGRYSRIYREWVYVNKESEPIPYTKATVDLLNFIKWYRENRGTKEYVEYIWSMFENSRPKLAKMLLGFDHIRESKVEPEEVRAVLGNHNMAVELISLHDTNMDSCSRATWRIKCPLSIAVQILRHRSGSYNMVSARYKTIFQEMVSPSNDCQDIFEKIGLDLDSYFDSTGGNIAVYRITMMQAKKAMREGVISNKEYKRLREVARFILPEGRMTELYATFYLDDFYNNFVKLRNSTHAQMEHVWIAQEMQRLLEETRQNNRKLKNPFRASTGSSS